MMMMNDDDDDDDDMIWSGAVSASTVAISLGHSKVTIYDDGNKGLAHVVEEMSFNK